MSISLVVSLVVLASASVSFNRIVVQLGRPIRASGAKEARTLGRPLGFLPFCSRGQFSRHSLGLGCGAGAGGRGRKRRCQRCEQIKSSEQAKGSITGSFRTPFERIVAVRDEQRRCHWLPPRVRVPWNKQQRQFAPTCAEAPLLRTPTQQPFRPSRSPLESPPLPRLLALAPLCARQWRSSSAETWKFMDWRQQNGLTIIRAARSQAESAAGWRAARLLKRPRVARASARLPRR